MPRRNRKETIGKSSTKRRPVDMSPATADLDHYWRTAIRVIDPGSGPFAPVAGGVRECEG